MNITAEIKEYARELGFCKIGISPMQKYERLLAEAQARNNYGYWLESFGMGADPGNLMPEGKSVIVLAYDYARCDFPENLLKMIGRVYLSRCYLPQPGSQVYEMLKRFEGFLREQGMEFVPDRNTLMMRPAAERAGVASFGQNNFAYVDGVGSFVLLYGYVVDRELEYDAPAEGCKCPPNCRACVNACPTKALYAPFRLDPAKCIGYNNWMRHSGRVDEVVPRELRSQMGCHVHGCDLCQEACPRNQAKLKGEYPKDALLENIGERFTLQNLLHMPEGFYEECVQPVMYNYIRDKKYFQRNAAIAMGNTKEGAFIPDLIRELSNPEELIRLHAAWALGQMKDEDARRALRERMHAEHSEMVLQEIRLALAGDAANCAPAAV